MFVICIRSMRSQPENKQNKTFFAHKENKHHHEIGFRYKGEIMTGRYQEDEVMQADTGEQPTV